MSGLIDYQNIDYVVQNKYIYLTSQDGLAGKTDVGTATNPATYTDDNNLVFNWENSIVSQDGYELILTCVDFKLDNTFNNIYNDNNFGNNIVVITHLALTYIIPVPTGSYTPEQLGEELTNLINAEAGFDLINIEWRIQQKKFIFFNLTVNDIFLITPSNDNVPEQYRNSFMLSPLGILECFDTQWVIPPAPAVFISPKIVDVRRTRTVKVNINFLTNSVSSNESNNVNTLCSLNNPYILDNIQNQLSYSPHGYNLINKVHIPSNNFNSIGISIVDDNAQRIVMHGGGYECVFKTELIPQQTLPTNHTLSMDQYIASLPQYNKKYLEGVFMSKLNPKFNRKRQLAKIKKLNDRRSKIKKKNDTKNKIDSILQLLKDLN